MATAYTAVDVMDTSPDSDGTTFMNPILPLNEVPWLLLWVQDQGLEVGKRSLDNVTMAELNEIISYQSWQVKPGGWWVMGDLLSTRRCVRETRKIETPTSNFPPLMKVVFNHDIHLNHTAMAKKKNNQVRYLHLTWSCIS